MVDPAVAYQPYGPYQRGAVDDIFLKRSNGSYWLGVVWPGVTVFPGMLFGNKLFRPVLSPVMCGKKNVLLFQKHY